MFLFFGTLNLLRHFQRGWQLFRRMGTPPLPKKYVKFPENTWRISRPGPLDLSTGPLMELRDLHAVRLMVDVSCDLESLPRGSYGYTTPRGFNTTRGPSPIVVNQERGVFHLEIHKSIDGDIYLIGFMREYDRKRLRYSGGKVTLLSSFPEASHTLPVAVPVPRILTCLERMLSFSRKFNIALDIEVK